MIAKIKIRQCVIFVELRKFDTADIKCFTVRPLSVKHLGLGLLFDTDVLHVTKV